MSISIFSRKADLTLNISPRIFAQIIRHSAQNRLIHSFPTLIFNLAAILENVNRDSENPILFHWQTHFTLRYVRSRGGRLLPMV